MKLKYKFMLVIVTILLLSTLTIGSSYSLWLSNSTQLGENTMNIGCFNLTFEDSDAITLTNSYPIEHKVGRNLHPYTFTITNVCDYVASFDVNLELLSSTTLSDSDIRVMLNNGGSKLYSEYEEAEGVLSGDGTTLSDTSINTSRKIAHGVLWPNKSRTYSLRLWIDENVDASVMNKALHAKVVTISTPFNENKCTYNGELVQGAEYTDGTYTYRYMQEKEATDWQNITEDGWGVKLTDTAATGEVNTPICTSINGKPIVSMSHMFAYIHNLTKIDVSSYDTNNVINMQSMFSYTGSNATTFEIIGLDNFDTSNVTNMSYMFDNLSYSATTFNIGDLSSWDTSKVRTMENMFNKAGQNATTFDIGDLSSWDTSKVTTLYLMFAEAGKNATTFNIGNLSNWDISSATNISCLFRYSGYNATTWNIGDLSNWDTRNVTEISQIFEASGYNSSVFDIGDLSNWDISKVTTLYKMFKFAGYNATIWNIGDLSNWDTSKVTNMSEMFDSAGQNAITLNIGTLNVYATNIYRMFYGNKSVNGILNIYSNPSSGSSGYNRAFTNSATEPGSGITVNYSSTTTNIDAIIATKSSNSNVVKGVQLD